MRSHLTGSTIRSRTSSLALPQLSLPRLLYPTPQSPLSSSFGGYTEVPPPPTGVEHPTYQRRVSLSTYLSSDAGIQIPSSTPSSQQQITSDFNTSDLESDDDQSDDVFYTPFSSPPTSMLVDPPSLWSPLLYSLQTTSLPRPRPRPRLRLLIQPSRAPLRLPQTNCMPP